MKYWKHNGYTLFETPTGTVALIMGDPIEFPTEEEALEYIDEISNVIGGKDND